VNWEPRSWRTRTANQQPAYPDPERLDSVVAELARLPPLVTSWEVETLKGLLAKAARGELFVLQGGDCAESFEDCESSAITAKLKILLQMRLVLVHATKKGVVPVGRIAGQYAKPRSSPFEERDGVVLPAYRGDLVNRMAFTPEDRAIDPVHMLRGYERAALTLNFIRSLADAGFADLHHPEYWDLSFVRHSELAHEYERTVESIRESIDFMEAVAGQPMDAMRRVDFYTSHEALLLPYEEAQTRRVPRRTGWYNLATHLPWIGLRTNDLEGAHIEYGRGIANPIGVKIGPATRPEWLRELIAALNPGNEPGRLMLIHRMGAEKVADALPPLIEEVLRLGKHVTWCCDPMHGNTETTAQGYKTRRFDKILAELERAFSLHAELGSVLGGVHFELTGENVTECVGGARGLDEAGLAAAYRSQVDPRLNAEQALEMAMRIARHLRPERRSSDQS
jgi:3-deoxy-7-phosphoheptulonate synthase